MSELIYKHIGDNQYQLVAKFHGIFPPFQEPVLRMHAPRDQFASPVNDDREPRLIEHDLFDVRITNLVNEVTLNPVTIYELVSDISKIDSPKLELVKNGKFL